jgi:ABC-2 type transport system ATP-binding protein
VASQAIRKVVGVGDEPAIEARGLGVRLGGYPVFSGLDLSVNAGDTLAVLGSIGAGKTTLLRLLAGRVAPSAGTVRVLGLPPDDPALARDVALVDGEPEWEPGATVLQVLELARMAADVDDDTWPIPPRVMEAFGLEPRVDDLPFTLSQGLRQRLSLAAAFCRPSKVLLVDDPEFGLDAEFRPLLAEIFLGYAARGGTVVMGTHDLDLALAAKARTIAID